MKKILAVDVDDCVFPSTMTWHYFLELETKLGLTWDDVKTYYDISTLYKQELDRRSLDPMAFWRAANTYDSIVPYVEAVIALEKASERFDIVFVSALKGSHHKSKYEALKHWFPFMDGLLGTKEKKYTRCDFIIDDRLNNLEQFIGLDTKTIWFPTPAEQSSNYKPDYILDRWEDLENYIE